MASKHFNFDLIPFDQNDKNNITANGIGTNARNEELSVSIPLNRQESKWFNRMVESIRKRALPIDWEVDE